MIANNVVSCPHCRDGVAVPLPEKWQAGLSPHQGTCIDCDGTGQRCMFCCEPPAKCQCETVEECWQCGKLPWACECR